MVGTNVRLRAMEPSDVDFLFLWENDPATWEASDRKWPVSQDDINRFVRSSDLDIWQSRQMRFMVQTLDDARTVGCADIFDFDPLNQHCAFGIYIWTAERRRHFASEAIRLLERFAFETLGVASVVVTIDSLNEPSLLMFKSLGYSQAGLLKSYLRHGRDFSDQLILQKSYVSF